MFDFKQRQFAKLSLAGKKEGVFDFTSWNFGYTWTTKLKVAETAFHKKRRSIRNGVPYQCTKSDMEVSLHFSGGAELLVGKIKQHNIILSMDKTWCMKKLLTWVKDNLLKERPELFLQGDTVRPGILVLVNNADWELVGQLDYHLQKNDEIVFISTLHGG